MNRYEFVKLIAKTLRDSRYKSKLSQEHIALTLGVSAKTIQNWERGVSVPDLFQYLEWFKIIHINIFPYLMTILNEEELNDSTFDKSEDFSNVLNQCIASMTTKEKKQLLYILNGDHGSPRNYLLELLTAHCHTQMLLRVGVAQLIYTNYIIQEQTNDIVCDESILPDMTKLKQAIEKGTNAAIHKRNSYAK